MKEEIAQIEELAENDMENSMKLRTFKSNKLWRDKVIEMLEESGSIITWKRLKDDEFITQLKAKLIEETEEVIAASTKEQLVEELADVLEVMHALCDASNITFDEVIAAQCVKNQKKGGFAGRKFVEMASHPINSAAEKYFLADPAKYPEITE